MKTKNKPPKTHNCKRNKTTRIKTYAVDLIFDFIKKNPAELFFVDEDGNRCKLRRAKVFFEKGLNCVTPGCKLSGSFFALEQWELGDFHFDLFAIDDLGEEVLMTVDHVYPKSKGGKNSITNYQPMCKVHNELKADII